MSLGGQKGYTSACQVAEKLHPQDSPIRIEEVSSDCCPVICSAVRVVLYSTKVMFCLHAIFVVRCEHFRSILRNYSIEWLLIQQLMPSQVSG